MAQLVGHWMSSATVGASCVMKGKRNVLDTTLQAWYFDEAAIQERTAGLVNNHFSCRCS